jgi:hypothetical protein
MDEYLCRDRRFGGVATTNAVDDTAASPSVLDPARWKRLLGNRS